MTCNGGLLEVSSLLVISGVVAWLPFNRVSFGTHGIAKGAFVSGLSSETRSHQPPSPNTIVETRTVTPVIGNKAGWTPLARGLRNLTSVICWDTITIYETPVRQRTADRCLPNTIWKLKERQFGLALV